VAEIIGKTLDKVGGVICEMLSENANDVAIDIGTEEADAVAVVKNAESTNESKSGELIINSNDVEDADDSDCESDSEWSVVKSVVTTESEQIRQATQFVGSALFNSDIKTSSEDGGVSDLIGSNTSFSVPGSVPSEVLSLNSRMTEQSGRWEKELEKLRELGFFNNSASILALEKVEEMSNNAGTELDFDKVVNELLDMNA